MPLTIAQRLPIKLIALHVELGSTHGALGYRMATSPGLSDARGAAATPLQGGLLQHYCLTFRLLHSAQQEKTGALLFHQLQLPG
jgi:hypothetical protein